MNDLIAATQAMNEQSDRMRTFMDGFDAEIAARAASYDALAANLSAVADSRLFFSAVVDPSETAPSNERGGTFNSIAAAIAAAPRNSYVVLELAGGQNHNMDVSVPVYGQYIHLKGPSAANRAILQVAAYSTGAFNSLYVFEPHGNPRFRFENVDIVFPDALPDPVLPWSSRQGLIHFEPAGVLAAAFEGCNISGGVIGAEPALVSGAYQTNNVALYSVDLDGPVRVIRGVDAGVATIQTRIVTLANGAALNEGGTLGTNLLLQN
ncbi:MAG: hypothetical protein OQK00_06380 [Rhodobacteraceae bacterium]|nr:hypothetical protein [Paracoccaceae bacterium]